MPQIGWFELLIIIIISILVIGPKDFPLVLRKIGKWIGSVKKYFSEMQSSMNEITNINDIEEKKENKSNNNKQDE